MFGTPFRFRLERVRAVRQHREEAARLDLAVAIAKLLASERRLQAVDARLVEAQDQQRSAADSAVSAADLLAHQSFVEEVERQRSRKVQETKRSAGKVADCGAVLGRAAREREMLERLKAHRHSEHMLEQARREGAALDEIAINARRTKTV